MPYNNNNAYAAEGTTLLADDSSPSASLSVANSILSNNGKTGEVVTMSSDITISATLINNYNLQISGNPVLEGPTSINATTATVSVAEDLANNTWGYSWNDTNYRGITTTSTTIANDGISDAGSVSYTRPLTFAAKFGADANAGHYKTQVNLLLTATPKTLTTYTMLLNNNGGNGGDTAASCSTYLDTCTINVNNIEKPTIGIANTSFFGWATNPNSHNPEYLTGSTISMSRDNNGGTLYAIWKDTRNMSQISNMQDVNWGICQNTPVGQEYRLTDSRDSKSYWIAKLADNNCWMVQNLDFDIPSTLNSTTSDIESTNLATNTIKVTNISSWANPSTGETYNAYYDPGNYYYIGVDNTHNTSGTECTPSLGPKNCDLFTTNSNDSHYHLGNFYSFSAATVSSADSDNSKDAPYSICPKNWMMPKSNGNTVNGSFGYMLNQYGLTSKPSNANYAIYDAPLYFVYGGHIFGGYFYTGASGYYWSSTPNKTHSSLAYGLLFTYSSVSPTEITNGSRSQAGRPIRCLAK